MTSTTQLQRFLLAFSIVISISILIGSSSDCLAQEPVNFARDIKPILAENCFACHGTDAETRAADLRLDEREAAIDHGAFEPGNADESSLVERLYEDGPDAIMPPADSGKKLTDAEKELLKRWIDEGAEYSKHWSLVAPQKSDLP